MDILDAASREAAVPNPACRLNTRSAQTRTLVPAAEVFSLQTAAGTPTLHPLEIDRLLVASLVLQCVGFSSSS